MRPAPAPCGCGAAWEVEDGDVGDHRACTYQVSGSKVADPDRRPAPGQKSFPWSRTLRGRVRSRGIRHRLVITPRSNRVDLESLMAHLFATTDLERTLPG